MEKKNLEGFPFWSHLTAEEKREAEAEARPVIYKENRLIASTASDCLGVLYLFSGVIRICLASEDGREVTIARLEEGDLCLMSASCLIAPVSFSVQVFAETETEAVLLPIGTVNRLKEENVYVESCIYRLMAERFSEVISAVEQILFLSLEQRVVAFLLDESARTGSSEISVTQEKIARSIGSAREAVSRSLKKLAEGGFIAVSRGKIELLKKKELYQKL